MECEKLKLLVVDDDFTQVKKIETYIKHIEYPEVKLLIARTAEQAIEIVMSESVDLVLSDYIMPGKNGLELLKEVKQINPVISVVIMTAFGNAREAVEILQNGGDDYLIKPTKKEDIEHLLIVAHEKNCISRENQSVDEEIEHHFENNPLVYSSKSMRNVLNIVARTSESDATVLITGESGTGKELIAGLIHSVSRRKEKPIVTVNLAALPESLLESELFGHVKGAFTGADSDREGRFEEADGGTLFIDEIGEIPLSVQVKLLRAIQFNRVQRVGENRERKLDVRIIAATNRNLEYMIEEKLFRSDLYWRLNVVRIDIPPLRKRKDDIISLSEYFLRKYAEENNRKIESISKKAMDILMKHSFPGNVRELENIIERSVIMSRSSVIKESDFSFIELSSEKEYSLQNHDKNYESAMKEFETGFLLNALEESEGNQSKAARMIGISERRLRSRLSILEIKKE